MLSRRKFLGASAGALLAARGVARNPRGFPTGSVGTTYKFNPGDYILSGVVYSTSIANLVSDLSVITGAGTTGFKGYAAGFNWYNLETSTSSTSPTYNFAGVWQTFLYLQALWPGARFMVYLTGNHYGQSITSTAIQAANLNQSSASYYVPGYILNCGGSVTIPNSYGSSSTTSYSVAANYSGASTYGLNFQAINGGGTAFTAISPQWYNPGVMQAFINMVQALSQSTCPTPSAYSSGTTYSAGQQATSSGNTYTYINATASAGNAVTNTTYWALTNQAYAGQTLDQISLFEYLGFNDEVSYGFVSGSYSSGGQNFASGPTVNSPLSVTGAAPSNTNFWVQRLKLLNAVTGFFPHTMIGCCDSFGYGASGYGTDSPGNLAANVNGNIPGGYRTASAALSSIVGVAFSNADSLGYDLNPTTNYASSGKQGFYGIESVGAQGAALPTPAYTNLLGYMPYIAQVQPADYGVGSSGYYNALAVQDIMQAQTRLQASHRIWCVQDDHTSGGGWSGTGGYIRSTILANQSTYPVSTTIPSNL